MRRLSLATTLGALTIAAVFALGLRAVPAWAFDAKKADVSVVRVIVFEVKNGRRTGTYSSGTGFVVDNEYVVTNDHVTDDAEFRKDGGASERVVVDGSRQNLRPAQLVWAAPELDLAVLRVPGLARPALTLSGAPPADRPGKGEAVWAIGYPGIADRSIQSDDAFLNSTVTQGVVGKVVQGRAGQKDKVRPVIQHNASINKGNSGGPLFDDCGTVVGVNTFGALSTMEVKRDNQGRDIAAGMPNTGIFYSPHIASFIEAQRTVAVLKPIALKLSAAPCTAASSSPAEPAGLPLWIYGVIAVVSLLALTSTVVAFRKGTTREIVRVVESYSAYLRRKDAPPSILNRRRARAATAPPAPRTGAPARAPAASPSGGWVLSGLGKQKTFRIELRAEELAAAASGSEGGLVVGRSGSLCDRVVDDPSVSRRHAKFFVADGTLMVEDMGSAFGTKVNDQAVAANQAERIAVGDRVVLGGVSFAIAHA